MRKSRFSEEQIIAILKESEAGVETEELCRRHGITRACFDRWKAKYGGMDMNEARRLRALEEENRQLKHIVAEQAVDIRALKAVGLQEIGISKLSQATLLGDYWNAAQRYLETGDSSALQEFAGKHITDANRKEWPLLTDLDGLDQLASAGVLSFESIYARAA